MRQEQENRRMVVDRPNTENSSDERVGAVIVNIEHNINVQFSSSSNINNKQHRNNED
jgi:hypothetical protein